MEKEETITTSEIKTPVPEVPVAPVVPVEQKTGCMPRKTLILIILLIIVTIGLLVIALMPNLKFPTSVKPTPTPAALSYAQTELSLSAPASTTFDSYSTDALISTGNNKTTAVQLEISYDPKILTNVSITPGTFFTNPVVLLKKIDAVNGTISYALGINPSQKPTNGSGIVATITFSAVATVAATQTPINFEPKTAATAVGYSQSVLKQSTGILLTLPTTK